MSRFLYSIRTWLSCELRNKSEPSANIHSCCMINKNKAWSRIWNLIQNINKTVHVVRALSRFAWIYFYISYLCISCSSHTYLDNTSACDAHGNNVDKQTISEHNENITTIYIKVMCMYSIHAAKRIWSLPGLAYFFCSKRCKLAMNQQLGQKASPMHSYIVCSSTP